MILTRRQDDILLINYLSHTPSHSFLLGLLGDEWTDLTLINVVSTISKLDSAYSTTTTYERKA